METSITTTLPKTPSANLPSRIESIIEFYNQATVDYAYWSKGFNMHYGFLKNWKQFFHREQMLEEMNKQVVERLKVNPSSLARIIDLGCGVGATCRHIAKTSANWKVTGINIVQEHIQKGNQLNRLSNTSNQINLVLGNYQNVPLPSDSFDGLCALESMCHATNKAQLLTESLRLLKPGSKLVITDCFRRSQGKIANPVSALSYEAFKKNWRVELANIDSIEQTLTKLGFQDITIEDIRSKVAPSVMHSPYVVLKFFIGELFKGRKIGRENLKNIKAVLQSIPIGLDHRNFSYFIITATKPKDSSK